MTAQMYRDEVLDLIVTPYAGAVGEGFIFVHTLPGYVRLIWISNVLM